MKKDKLVYEAPEAEIFVLGFEGFLCASDPANAWHPGGGGSYCNNDTNDNGDY